MIFVIYILVQLLRPLGGELGDHVFSTILVNFTLLLSLLRHHLILPFVSLFRILPASFGSLFPLFFNHLLLLALVYPFQILDLLTKPGCTKRMLLNYFLDYEVVNLVLMLRVLKAQGFA